MNQTTTQAALAEAFRRLTAALADTEGREGGPQRAEGIRTRLVAHIDGHITELRGKPEACRVHVGWPAHNCGPCRSERIGAD